MPATVSVWGGGKWGGVTSVVQVTTVAMIGDSTLYQGGTGEATLRTSLGPDFPEGIFFYAMVGKPIILLDDAGYSALDNMAQARAQLGREPDLWLMNLGSNGHQRAPHPSTNIGWINQVMDDAVSPIVWIGISQADGYVGDGGASTPATRQAWNAIAKPTVLSHPNGIWADWNAHIKARSGGDADLWGGDGVHMTPAGYEYKNNFFVAQLVAAKATISI